jgi:amino acid transporter
MRLAAISSGPLILGIAAVTGLYVMVNVAFLHALGYTGLAASDQVATDAVSAVFPRWGSRLISALVCISALGAVNGLIFTGARISYAVGADHCAFGLLGTWSAKTGTPIRALVLQGLLALTLIILLKDFVETVLYTAPAVYLFYMATSLAVVVLRRREPGVDRPYRVTGYPFTTLVFVAACGFLIYSGITYAIYVKEKPWIVLVPIRGHAGGNTALHPQPRAAGPAQLNVLPLSRRGFARRNAVQASNALSAKALLAIATSLP